MARKLVSREQLRLSSVFDTNWVLDVLAFALRLENLFEFNHQWELCSFDHEPQVSHGYEIAITTQNKFSKCMNMERRVRQTWDFPLDLYHPGKECEVKRTSNFWILIVGNVLKWNGVCVRQGKQIAKILRQCRKGKQEEKCIIKNLSERRSRQDVKLVSVTYVPSVIHA